ncbi:GNAT family N-acetyltransferase [Ectobacillus antri]|jgi:ribosomal protein S18 acetylase RimI-like enzyme|uniref:GNAT family N-acetyltransferase n=1 Tax=Ectobacillus antri TaxID=2486280 RepID=A0ABT6H5Q8_9BACI|nr:GNAT family N-acetyltransferase [Ectobacillus antri]MDG4658407.1 GNAT family N-acetyltransferase [Ectobacillus antri]MDG5753741.1 GNAT family N-acetyltransferase [Ectobacillus antri]
MIRNATITDQAEVAVLLYNALHEIAEKLTGGNTYEEVLTGLRYWFSQPGNRLSYENCLIAEQDGHPVGVIVLYHGSEASRLDEPIVTYLRKLHGDASIILEKEAGDDEYYIDTLSVHPDYSGRGIGSTLMRKAEEQCLMLGYHKIAILADLSNTRALSLYRYRGYTQDYTITLVGESFAHLSKTFII